MTAFSYTDWSSKSADEQKNQPGVSIERTNLVNNPNRGAYWSPETAAGALGVHLEQTLAGDDRVAARRMWNGLRNLHRQATESPRMIDRAMDVRQSDAHNALGAYNNDLDHAQLEQLSSVFDDVVALQTEAQLVGVDPIAASRRMLQRAASRAVGYSMSDNAIEAEMRPLVESPRGAAVIANMNQSVGQLQALLKDRSLDSSSFEDALDNIPQIGRDTGYTDELRDDHRRLNSILESVPLVLNPQDVEAERNFSVRMESQQEATVMETVIRWAGEQERLPTKKEINRAFSSWRDNGVSDSPYSSLDEPALGVIVGNGVAAQTNLSNLVANVNKAQGEAPSPIVVMAIEPTQAFRDALAATGRTIVDVTPEADARGVHLSSRGQDLPGNRIELLALTRDQADDPVTRSLAANGFVGRADRIGFVAGSTAMAPVEAQAIHLGGTLRKMALGISANGEGMDSKALIALRKTAREVDAEADPQRYYTAGTARPHRGVSAVAFDGATKYDAANRANAPDRDVIGEAYASIPKSSTILTVENEGNAINKWMASNVTDRKVLYAEATRSLSFAEIAGVALEGERRFARESEMELKIYDRPAAQRRYGFAQQGRDGEEMENPGNMAGVRRVCLDKDISWDDKEVRGAIILVAGNANSTAINTSSQAIKIAQEAVMDRAHTALILSDMTDKRASTDFHAAHMIRLAGEMGKKATVIDGRGTEMPLDEAREKTAGNAENYTQKQGRVVDEMQSVQTEGGRYGRNAPIDVTTGDNLGQLALAALPGMDAAHAIQFANSGLTLKEIRTDKSDEMRAALIDLHMPAKTRAVIHDSGPWMKAMERSIDNLETAGKMGAKLHVPSDIDHPIDQMSGGQYRHAVFSMGTYDFDKEPLAAFIGNSERFRQPGQTLSLSAAQKAGPGAEKGTMVDPAEAVDRPTLRRSIEEMTRQGYGIGVTMEEGVSRAVIEEAAHVRGAKVVVMAPGNFNASTPELRAAVRTLFEQDRAAVLMPVNIAPHPAPEPRNGEERKPDSYSEDRAGMQNMLATAAKVGVVVASGAHDQSMHVVRRMVDQEKPIAAMVPQDIAMAGTDLYSGNMKLLRGGGTTSIESRGLAQAPSAQAYAEISDDRDQTELINGVRQSTAGSFQSARLGRSDMLRSGHHHLTFGWGEAAHPISSKESVQRFVDEAENGMGSLGRYVAPTEQEMEKRRLARTQRELTREETRISLFVQNEFSGTSALHRSAIEKEADRRIDIANMDDDRYARTSSDAMAARQAAAAGHSMG